MKQNRAVHLCSELGSNAPSRGARRASPGLCAVGELDVCGVPPYLFTFKHIINQYVARVIATHIHNHITNQRNSKVYI